MLKEGDRAPEITLTDQYGDERTLSKEIGPGWTIVYFYPRDGTPVCTAQACSFRDASTELSEKGAKVIGISSDRVSTHGSFAKKYELSFILLSDEKGEARKIFGVPNRLGLLPGRVTFVIDEKGVIRMVFDSLLRGEDHVTKSLEFIRSQTHRI